MGYSNIKFDDNSKFLVTGAAGFIGSNLVETLCEMGYKVIGLDDFSNGLVSNIDRLKEKYDFEFINGTIEDIEVCREACRGVDYILHQAAWGSVPRSMEMPIKYNKVNVDGTLNMLEAARENNVKRFVYASSSSVYGDNETLPKKVGQEGSVLSPYAMTKKINEYYADLFYKIYNLPTIGLRYFNVFGRYQNPNGNYAAVIPKFVKALIENRDAIIYGDGTQSRDFTYIENVIEANLKACLSDEKSFGRAYNVAYGEKFTINQVLESMCKELNVSFKPKYSNARKGDIKHSLADIDETKNLLGYNPTWNFENGFKETIEWYKNNL
ncbi:UDP-N-acetylglucosamine 4-epimerase [Clostridium collagenovorans DSM 3089]|uniref:UDP-N-acetylglucosamine 4-epimerase n=1 Tax=Clostridium collagenovorans DSM 3089 TaxID=1121306 RepID=A0A1M5X3W6_9CLOT|nr:SDR family oxidoreductase [Clostridium collagenovorans]SHH94292.1 UDP-N-acetylglucosamine 4-epimerase [Clostridium collagenovorans DSM 3089]